MYNHLVEIGLYDNKTKTLNSKNLKIPDIYIWHFIRGYFDGDGCISINKPKSNKNITPTCYNISITGFKNNLDFFRDVLSNFKINSQFLEDKRSSKADNIFGNLRIGSFRDRYLFLKFLYKDSDLKMERKFLKSLEFINLVEKGCEPRYKNAVEEYNNLLM